MSLNFTRPKTIEQTRSIASLRNNIDRQEAEILLSHVLKRPREYLITHGDEKIPIWDTWKFFRAVRRRFHGVPIAHITGHKEFYGLDFFVNKHTLIPRPETELLIECVATTVNSRQPTDDYDQSSSVDRRPSSVVLIDIGTGTGCIPIAILKTFPPEADQPLAEKHKSIKAYAIDISRPTLRIAKKNAKHHGVDITLLYGNLLEPIINNKKSEICNLKSEIIITANLPYLTAEQFAGEPSIRHEPKTALVAEDGGLALYKKLLKQIVTLPHCQIVCFFEIDPSQSVPLSTYIQKHFPNAVIEIKKDLAGRDRVMHITISSDAQTGEKK
ncbi:MAG: peptide chain release factor N(5)-glutamine methyltransferase [Patescibacteria group bacterium]